MQVKARACWCPSAYVRTQSGVTLVALDCSRICWLSIIWSGILTWIKQQSSYRQAHRIGLAGCLLLDLLLQGVLLLRQVGVLLLQPLDGLIDLHGEVIGSLRSEMVPLQQRLTRESAATLQQLVTKMLITNTFAAASPGKDLHTRSHVRTRKAKSMMSCHVTRQGSCRVAGHQ